MKLISKGLLAALFMGAGLMHFLKADLFLQIMPPYLPMPLLLVYLSGAFEIALGLFLLIPKYCSWAAWGLILLLIAIFPANVHMALHPEVFPEIPQLWRWIRLPFQLVLIAWAYCYTK